MTAYVCHSEERRIFSLNLRTNILRKRSSEWPCMFVILRNEGSCPFWPSTTIYSKRSSEWQRIFVIVRNEGSCPLVYGLRFFAKEAQNVRVCLSSWGTKDLVLWSLSCHPEERRILLFGLWVIILRNEGSCPFGQIWKFIAKETQNVRVCLSSWGTKDLVLWFID